MICPNCKTESLGAKWCPECGLRLEIEDVANIDFNKSEKGDTQKLRPVSFQKEELKNPTLTHKDKQGGKKESSGQKKTGSRFTDNGFNYWVIAIGVVTVLVVLFIILKLTGVIPTKQPSQLPASNEEVVLEKEDSSTILKTGLDELKLGNYDEAETMFKAVLETDPKNAEANTLYQIVYNYNRSAKKIQSGKYEDAREFFDEIPLDYENYSIKTDIENLDEEISGFEIAYRSFEQVQQHMSEGRYEDALDTISLIDKNFLAKSDAVTLDEYSAEINKYLESQKEENKEASDDDMSHKKAEIIITEYCEDLAMAINSKDFSIVEKHISGQLYNDQKKNVQNCIDKAMTKSFDKLEIINVYSVSDTKWKVDVSEGETLYHQDGTQTAETRSRTYTIEYIDSEYYLTALE